MPAEKQKVLGRLLKIATRLQNSPFNHFYKIPSTSPLHSISELHEDIKNIPGEKKAFWETMDEYLIAIGDRLNVHEDFLKVLDSRLEDASKDQNPTLAELSKDIDLMALVTLLNMNNQSLLTISQRILPHLTAANYNRITSLIASITGGLFVMGTGIAVFATIMAFSQYFSSLELITAFAALCVASLAGFIGTHFTSRAFEKVEYNTQFSKNQTFFATLNDALIVDNSHIYKKKEKPSTSPKENQSLPSQLDRAVTEKIPLLTKEERPTVKIPSNN